MSQRLYRLLVLPGTRRISLINAGSVTPICFFQSFLSAVPLDHPLPFLGCSLLLLVGAAQGWRHHKERKMNLVTTTMMMPHQRQHAARRMLYWWWDQRISTLSSAHRTQ